MSCLFDSLAVGLRNLEINLTSPAIRKAICDYLEAGSVLIEGFGTPDLLALEHESYVRHMRIDTTMGGAIEIQAACCLWDLKIYVQTSSSEIEFLPVVSEDLIKTIRPLRSLRLKWFGAHYEPA